jgi:hypothetical protein
MLCGGAQRVMSLRRMAWGHGGDRVTEALPGRVAHLCEIVETGIGCWRIRTRITTWKLRPWMGQNSRSLEGKNSDQIGNYGIQRQRQPALEAQRPSPRK